MPDPPSPKVWQLHRLVELVVRDPTRMDRTAAAPASETPSTVRAFRLPMNAAAGPSDEKNFRRPERTGADDGTESTPPLQPDRYCGIRATRWPTGGPVVLM